MTYIHEFPPETGTRHPTGDPTAAPERPESWPESWITGLYGQDFGLRLGPDEAFRRREIRARRRREIRARRRRSAETARLIRAALGRAARAARDALTAYRRWNARLALEAMTDHRLRAIGLGRDRIAGLFDGTADGAAPAAMPGETVVVPFSGATGRGFAAADAPAGTPPGTPPGTPGTPGAPLAA